MVTGYVKQKEKWRIGHCKVSSLDPRLDGEMALPDVEVKLALKEKECAELRVLRSVQEESASLRRLYQHLRSDFHFNLEILDEQNKELERYDALILRALAGEHHRQAELNQLQTQISKLQKQKIQEATEHRSQLQELKCDLHRQMEKYERMKEILQHDIRCVEAGREKQGEEMSRALEEELKLQKQHFHLEMTQMQQLLQSHEDKEKQLHKEAEIYSQAHLQAAEALKASKVLCQELQTQLQHKHQQIKDIIRTNDSKIKELENQLKWRKTQQKKVKNDMKKQEDEVWALREREARLEAQCQAYKEQLHKTQEHVGKLQTDKDALAARARCAQEELQKAAEQREEIIQRLQSEMNRTRSDWDSYIQKVCTETVAKDTEIFSLQEKSNKLSAELERSRELSESYKQQVSAGLRREQEFEVMRVQMELEWQRRCEDTKAEVYLSNEQLIRDLTQAREQAQADLKEKEEELRDLTVLYHSVRAERDRAVQGLTPPVDAEVSGELKRLEEQNDQLRAVVSQMSRQMESFSHLPQPARADPPGPSVQISIPPGAHALTPNQQAVSSQNVLPKLGPQGEHTQPCAEVTDTQSPYSHSTRQGATLQQLPDNNLPRQQRASSQKSSGRSENIHPTSRRDASVLHARLKQAAGWIVRLSNEKQQLIELGNRLRAQITTGELQVKPARSPSTEKAGLQCDRLSLLEQLQQRLTTQELQFALKQSAVPPAEQLVPEPDQPRPLTSDPLSISNRHKPSESSSHKERRGASRLSGLSSDESLQQLWDLLDAGLRSSIFSEAEAALDEGLGVQTAEQGGASTCRLPPHQVQQERNLHNTPSNSRPHAASRRRKIRNYNMKD